MADIKLKLDVVEGTLDVECSGDDFETVMAHAERVLEKFADTQTRPTSEAATPDPEVEVVNPEGSIKNSEAALPSKSKSKRRRGGSNSPNWKIVDDLLDTSQRVELKAFFAEKAPTKQNDQVAVLVYKLKEFTKRSAFDGNEIHTAFQAVGAKTPANLSSVFANMAGEDLGGLEDKMWVPTFKSDDLVNHDLPRPAKG